MVKSSDVIFENLACIQVKNDYITIWITREVGPRILGLALDNGKNLLVILPDAKIPVDGAEDYSLRGGHRLWYGPENPATTYITDDQPLEIVTIENGLKVAQPPDKPTGIQKSMQVVLDEDQALITIDHRLTNLGNGDFRLAPWAITMLRPGGMGLIPLQDDLEDQYGLLPNRQLVFWPYTEINSPHLEINDRTVTVRASLTDGALKIGSPNPSNWLAYALDGVLFVKRSEYQKVAW